MECPICCDGDHVEVDTHADGFSGSLLECGSCGALWSLTDGQVKVLHGRTMTKVVGHRAGECPFCHNVKYVELDMHSDGFSKDMLECGFCGAVWSGIAPDVSVLHGPTWEKTFTTNRYRR